MGFILLLWLMNVYLFFFFQAEDGIRDLYVTGVQTCALTISVALLVRYFQQQGAAWELSADIRRMATFREMNLAKPWPTLPLMDLILLRNVMIYFDVEAKREILARAARILRPDGYLLLGSAETTYNLSSAFERVEHDKAGFYQLVP